MKVYAYKKYGKKYKVRLEIGKYACGKHLAIEMIYWDTEDKMWLPWSTLTVNLPQYGLSENYAFIDTNNNGEEIVKWLEKNNLAKFQDGYGYSGMCAYPLFYFEPDVLREIDPEGYQRYIEE